MLPMSTKRSVDWYEGMDCKHPSAKNKPMHADLNPCIMQALFNMLVNQPIWILNEDFNRRHHIVAIQKRMSTLRSSTIWMIAHVSEAVRLTYQGVGVAPARARIAASAVGLLGATETCCCRSPTASTSSLEGEPTEIVAPAINGRVWGSRNSLLFRPSLASLQGLRSIQVSLASGRLL